MGTNTLSAQQTRFVSGKVVDPYGLPVAGIRVALWSTQDTLVTFTDPDGHYLFEDLARFRDYYLHLSVPNPVPNGLDGRDVLLLTDYLSNRLNWPLSLRFAADLDWTTSVTTFDLFGLINQVFAGLPSSFDDWRFVNLYRQPIPGYHSSDPLLRDSVFPIHRLQHHIENLDFEVIRIGDLDQSADPR